MKEHLPKFCKFPEFSKVQRAGRQQNENDPPSPQSQADPSKAPMIFSAIETQEQQVVEADLSLVGKAGGNGHEGTEAKPQALSL